MDDIEGRAHPLTDAEGAEVESIFLRHIDEDDAMSIMQELQSAGFVIAPSWRVVK